MWWVVQLVSLLKLYLHKLWMPPLALLGSSAANPSVYSGPTTQHNYSLCSEYVEEARSQVPPLTCLEPFQWEDCGEKPMPVVYYNKEGSRCEIGVWRGCLPNFNMFLNEYDCISTCTTANRDGILRTSYMNITHLYGHELDAGKAIQLLVKAFTARLSDVERKELHKTVNILQRPERISVRPFDQPTSHIGAMKDCILCRIGMGAIFFVLKYGLDFDIVIKEMAIICYLIGLDTFNACKGTIELNLPAFKYIVQNAPDATPDAFCGLLMQNSKQNVCPFEDSRFEWQVKLPPKSKNVCTKKKTKVSQKPLKIAIITDIHLDPTYEPNSEANCADPICCMKGQNRKQKVFLNKSQLKVVVEPNNNVFLNNTGPSQPRTQTKSRKKFLKVSDPAGYWGAYRKCDTPTWTFEDAIDTVRENHKNIDIVYYIGDSIGHNSWETTYESVIYSQNYVISKFKNTFGKHVKFILPAIGNHEPQPMNLFAPATITKEGLNSTWLYGFLANKWGCYLTQEAKETFRKQGDYSILVRPGFRVISLNNNVAYKVNWWLVYDPKESKKHLDWLVAELYKAERAGEKVHILTHIPPGIEDLTFTWSREYNRIINRFSSTITAQFNGHTHFDQFKIFYDKTRNPVSVSWGGGGVTTYHLYNLNYKIATFNSTTFEPENFENYVYNLTEANLNPKQRPRWFMLYNMKNSLQLADLSPKSMNDLIHRMVTSHKELLQLYSEYVPKMSDPLWQKCNNDSNCLLAYVCEVVITVLWQREYCDELIKLYNS